MCAIVHANHDRDYLGFEPRDPVLEIFQNAFRGIPAYAGIDHHVTPAVKLPANTLGKVLMVGAFSVRMSRAMGFTVPGIKRGNGDGFVGYEGSGSRKLGGGTCQWFRLSRRW